MANKIKKGDEVIITSGSEKGSKGIVGKVVRGQSHRKITHVYVNGLGLRKKTKKPNPQLNERGGIVDLETPIAIAKVAIFNSSTKKSDRVGFKVSGEGKKQRIFRSSGEPIQSK